MKYLISTICYVFIIITMFLLLQQFSGVAIGFVETTLVAIWQTFGPTVLGFIWLIKEWFLARKLLNEDFPTYEEVMSRIELNAVLLGNIGTFLAVVQHGNSPDMLAPAAYSSLAGLLFVFVTTTSSHIYIKSKLEYANSNSSHSIKP